MPSDSRFLHHLRELIEYKRFDDFFKASEEALADSKNQIAVKVLQAIAHHQRGMFGKAQALFEQLEVVTPTMSLDEQVDWSALLVLRGQVDAACQWLDQVLAKQPEHDLALARRAWCRMVLGDAKGAEADLSLSLAQAPARLSSWLLLARLRLLAGDAQTAIDQARDLFVEQSKSWPEEVCKQTEYQLHELQLACWLQSDQLAEVEAWIATFEEGDAATHWHCAYAQALAARNRHSEAEDCLRRVLKNSKEKASAEAVPLLLTLAELAEVQGRRGQAMQIIRQAIAKDKDNPQLWARLARMSVRGAGAPAQKAVDKAQALADKLVESAEYPAARIAAIRLQVKLSIAETKSQAQHYEEADQLFREILAEHPWHVGALRALGGQALQRGHIDEAVALFEKVKAIDPVSGHMALINARQFPEDDQTLLHLDRAARQPSLEGPVRSGMLFQLAAAWEKRKDYGKAFAYAREANELSKRFLQYDPKEHRQKCARIRERFSPALYEHRKDSGHPSTLPVFVLGMPRSGTTLVEQIIAGHSKIFGAGELGVVTQRIAGLQRWERHVGSGRKYPDCVDDLDPYVINGIAESMLKELQEYAAEDKPQALHVVDKLPHNFENIGLIKFLFPNAKIISVRRDPRDIALSNFFTDYAAKHGGMGFAYDMTWIGEQLADHNLLMHHWQQVFPNQILEVQYEDVVENTEAMARKMLDYIGVSWEDQVLNFSELDRPVKTASVWQVRQPIYKTSTAKWKRYEKQLAPLIAGTNAKITWEPIEMLSLPEPGLLQKGVALYKQDKLDEAEYEFKKLLHHLPDHAAANHMVGIIYARKNHLNDAITLMEKSVKTCPWNKSWHKDLVQALEMAGFPERAQIVKANRKRKGRKGGKAST